MTNPIIEHIPHGQENAIKRSSLVAAAGMSDRKVRECVERQIVSNTKRAKAILHPNKFLKKVLDDYPEFDLGVKQI